MDARESEMSKRQWMNKKKKMKKRELQLANNKKKDIKGKSREPQGHRQVEKEKSETVEGINSREVEKEKSETVEGINSKEYILPCEVKLGDSSAAAQSRPSTSESESHLRSQDGSTCALGRDGLPQINSREVEKEKSDVERINSKEYKVKLGDSSAAAQSRPSTSLRSQDGSTFALGGDGLPQTDTYPQCMCEDVILCKRPDPGDPWFLSWIIRHSQRFRKVKQRILVNEAKEKEQEIAWLREAEEKEKQKGPPHPSLLRKRKP